MLWGLVLRIAVLGLCVGLLGCGRAPTVAVGFSLVGFQQTDGHHVLLNEPLVFHFSSELDPTSVTASSARVFDVDNRPVEGDFQVDGNRLVFDPLLAREVTLADGGFQPSSTFSVVLVGFPVPSGLRSREGRLLSSSFSSTFRTVALDGEGASFLDGSPDGAFALMLESASLGPLEPIRLSCVEPIDPRSLHLEAFQLRHYSQVGVFEEVALDLRLTANSMQTGAKLELRALEGVAGGVPRILEPGDYHLWIQDGEFAPRDLSGYPMRSAWASGQIPAKISVALRPSLAGSQHHRIDFLLRSFASPSEVPGTDGTVQWDGSGNLGLQLPWAAGDGAAGIVEFSGGTVNGEMAIRAARQDLHTARLLLPEGETLRFGQLQGSVVLRSQTSVHLNGQLERLSGKGPRARLTGEPWSAWFERVSRQDGFLGLSFEEGASLDEWLLGQEGDLTTIIAGGDLWIDGDIVVDGALVLAAGGRLRIRGRVEASEVWIVGVGGGAEVHPPARTSKLRLERSSVNRLVLPLRMGALTTPFRPDSAAPKWRSAVVGSALGAGNIRVRYLGERDLPSGDIETIGPVDDAALLDGCAGVRVWIELEIQPDVVWDPPKVDFVELRWTDEEDS